ncbi:putative nuclease HARBI1 [Temnothorax longispinosus]|uniref:putative nuclease HARBI1 n=1 Tax=Temnothorax longispinosus TaxID=300112 RepID=UPI003A99E257
MCSKRRQRQQGKLGQQGRQRQQAKRQASKGSKASKNSKARQAEKAIALPESELYVASRMFENHAVSPLHQLLLTLRFYATGTFQVAIGDFGGIHKSTMCRIIKKVTEAIASLRPRYINFPNSDQSLRDTKRRFYNIARFPKVVGAIDCTHVKIQSPGGEEAEVYRNRKGIFTMNVQAVCDSALRILDIVARWPGSTHDATIFNASRWLCLH